MSSVSTGERAELREWLLSSKMRDRAMVSANQVLRLLDDLDAVERREKALREALDRALHYVQHDTNGIGACTWYCQHCAIRAAASEPAQSATPAPAALQPYEYRFKCGAWPVYVRRTSVPGSGWYVMNGGSGSGTTTDYWREGVGWVRNTPSRYDTPELAMERYIAWFNKITGAEAPQRLTLDSGMTSK